MNIKDIKKFAEEGILKNNPLFILIAAFKSVMRIINQKKQKNAGRDALVALQEEA